MKEFFSPKNLNELFEILGVESCHILAGGTDFMLKKHLYTSKPTIYLGKISELKYIKIDEERIRIGAMTTIAELEKNQELKVLCSVFDSISSPAIKNVATIGGNFCNASPIADTLLFVYAMKGKVVLADAKSEREICVGDFIIAPKKVAFNEGEILKEINFKPLDDYSFIWKKVSGRDANALSKLSVFIAYKIKYGKLSDVRIAIGGMGPKVIRSFEMEKYLMKKFYNTREMHTSNYIQEAESYVEEYLKFLSPISDQRSTVQYKMKVCKNILLRAFMKIRNEITILS